MTIITRKSAIRTGATLNGLFIYATPTGLKIGTKGRVTRDASDIYSQLDKGSARKVRKALRAQGLNHLASAPRR